MYSRFSLVLITSFRSLFCLTDRVYNRASSHLHFYSWTDVAALLPILEAADIRALSPRKPEKQHRLEQHSYSEKADQEEKQQPKQECRTSYVHPCAVDEDK